MPQGSRKEFLAIVVAAMLAVAALSYFAGKAADTYRHGYFDLPLFIQVSVRHWRTEPVYQRSDDMANQYKPGAIVYKFPPPYLFNFLPWLDATGPVHPAFQARLTVAYIVIHFTAVLLVCWLVLRCRAAEGVATGGNLSASFVFPAIAFAAVYMPFFVVQGGTSGEGYIMALAVAAFAGMRRWPWLAGFLLAWLASLKLYPAFLLLYPLLTRQWRVLLAAAASFVLVALASLLVFGVGENLFYLRRILPILLFEQASEDWTEIFRHTTGNQGVVTVLVNYGVLPNRLPVWINTVRLPFVVMTTVLLLKYCRVHDERQWTAMLGFALLVVTTLVCLPNVFYAYLILLLFPLLALAGFLWARQCWWCLLLLLLVAGCLLVDDNWTYGMAKAAGILDPSPALVQLATQRGVDNYLWQEYTGLMLLSSYARLSPFLPCLLWLGIAAALPAAAAPVNRRRIPA